MPKATFTARWVATVPPPATGQTDYFDTKPPGLGLRVGSSGRKTWFVMYRRAGRLRRLTLGTYPALSLVDARQLAATARHQVAHGEDPASHKQHSRQAPTVGDVVTQYLALYARIHKRSWRTDERMLTREVLPQWGSRKAYDITRKDVLILLDRIVERGAPVTANRVLSLIRKMFNWAINRDLLSVNPCLQVKPPGKEHQRDRVLTEDEIRAFWAACEDLAPPVRIQLWLRLLTAQRGGETLTMRWEDLDLEAGWWTIPAHITKNGLSHRVPLSSPAVALLRDMQPVSGTGTWVFPSPYSPDQHFSRFGLHRYVSRVRARSDVSFVLHDLRRTAASHMTSMGISRLVVAKILNHTEPGVTAIYDRHSYDAEKRQALEAWAQRVLYLVTGETDDAGKVIPLHR